MSSRNIDSNTFNPLNSRNSKSQRVCSNIKSCCDYNKSTQTSNNNRSIATLTNNNTCNCFCKNQFTAKEGEEDLFTKWHHSTEKGVKLESKNTKPTLQSSQKIKAINYNQKRNTSTRTADSNLADNLHGTHNLSKLVNENRISRHLKESRIFNKSSREFLNLINQAIKFQKIFTIGNQNKSAYPTIRGSLTARGWVEKCCAETIVDVGNIFPSKLAENTIRLLKESTANFIWVINSVDFGNVKDDTIVSRFPKNNHFTTKVGLCSFLDDFHWFYEHRISKTIVPRTFKITNEDDIDNFMKDFGLTACLSLLKIVVNEISNAESDSFFKNGKVPINIVDFANAQCSEYILHRRHDDIDRQENVETTATEWNEFLSWFYLIAHEKEHFETASYPMIQALFTMSKMTLKNIEPYWPQWEYEGCKNLWVVKPAAQFCGRGIKVFRTVEDIINHVSVNMDRKRSHYIVQKYIECPLLIYNTKFDIRQWFLVTSIYPLVVWIYKECYLRFSSQPFSLDNLHESIHLTNNAIQRNYTNSSSRNPKLPTHNMWHNSTFQQHLKDIGEPDKWKDVILPGMKQGIVGVLLASQDEMIDRQNSFELYGADFLVAADYTPLLLEINMGPAMAPSTEVTADLCKRGLEDVIKVVLDHKHNAHADIGQFELLYRQEMGPKKCHLGLDLALNGSKIIQGRRIKKV